MRSRVVTLAMILGLLLASAVAGLTSEALAVESCTVSPSVAGGANGHGTIFIDSPILPLPGTGQFVWDGNSRPAGYGATTVALRPIPIVTSSLPVGWSVEGAYVGGRELSQQIIDATGVNNHLDPPWIGDCTQQVEGVDGRYDSGLTHHVVATWEFVNEQAHHGGTAISIHDLMRQYCLARKVAGWKVIVCTDLPRSGVPYATLAGFNTLIRLHWREYADAICDYAADARIGSEGAERNLVYWGSPVFPNGWDGWHMGDAGQAIAAETMQRAIAGLFPSVPQTFDYGTTPACVFTPEPGYHVAEVLVDGLPVAMTGANEYTFPPLVADHTISVEFAVDTFTISSSVEGGADGHGVVTPTGVQTLDYQSQPTYEFVPDAHYHVSEVRVDGHVVSMTAPNRFTFPAVTADHTLSVRFAIDRHTVSTTAIANGSVTPTSATVDYGGSAAFTFAPDAHFHARCPRSVTPGRRFIVSGLLRPRFGAGLETVRITAYRYHDGRWRWYRRYRAVNVDSRSASKYVAAITLGRPGKFRFRAVTPKTADLLAAQTISSRTMTVR